MNKNFLIFVFAVCGLSVNLYAGRNPHNANQRPSYLTSTSPVKGAQEKDAQSARTKRLISTLEKNSKKYHR